jgi:hypothetical protein
MSSQNGFSGERSMNGLISITGESIQASTINCDILETNTLIVNTNVDFDPSTTGDIYATNGTFDNLTVNSTVAFDPSTTGDIYATNGNFDNLTANTFSFPFTPTELNVGTNLFSNDEPTDFSVVFNQVDNYQYNITTGSTVDLITITIPSGIPSKLISWSMPCSWRTDLDKNLTGTITLNYGYSQNGILQTRWQVYKNGVLDSELPMSNDANTNTQNLVLSFTQNDPVSPVLASIDIFAFMGNLSGSFTTDYDDAVSNTYVVKLTWVSTTTQSATGGGTNTISQSLSLNTTRNYLDLVGARVYQFAVSTQNTPIGIALDKFVKGEGTQVGTTTVDNLIVNEIRSNVNLDEGFIGINNPISFNPTDPINMTGSAIISNTIKSPSFYSSPNDEYNYSIAFTSTLITGSVNNGNGSISRNATVSRNTSVLLQTVNIPQYYQNTSFSFDYPLTLIASFSSTTSLNQQPVILNTHTFNWTSSTFVVYKNDILWKTTALTLPTGGISTVITTVSPNQQASSIYTVSYTVYIGNAFGSWTPDFNYTTSTDVYTLYIVPNMTFTNSQSLSIVSGTFTLGINNSQTTRTYTSSGANWVINLNNFGSGYSTRTFTENLFANYAPTGLTIVDDLNANNITATTLTVPTNVINGTILKVNVSQVSTNTDFRVPFLSGDTGSQSISSDAFLTYNPNQDTLFARRLSGNSLKSPLSGVWLVNGNNRDNLASIVPLFCSQSDIEDISLQSTMALESVNGGSVVGSTINPFNIDNTTDMVIIMPNWGIIAYQNPSYGGLTRINVHNSFDVPQYISPDVTNSISSCQIFFRKVEITGRGS